MIAWKEPKTAMRSGSPAGNCALFARVRPNRHLLIGSFLNTARFPPTITRNKTGAVPRDNLPRVDFLHSVKEPTSDLQEQYVSETPL